MLGKQKSKIKCITLKSVKEKSIHPMKEKKRERERENIVSDLSGKGTERTSKKPLVNKSNKNTVKKKSSKT